MHTIPLIEIADDDPGYDSAAHIIVIAYILILRMITKIALPSGAQHPAFTRSYMLFAQNVVRASMATGTIFILRFGLFHKNGMFVAALGATIGSIFSAPDSCFKALCGRKEPTGINSGKMISVIANALGTS